MPIDVVIKLKSRFFSKVAESHVKIFSPHLTWCSDSLKRSAISLISLKQYHKTGSSKRVQKEKQAVQNRSVSV